jgi:hypothetical protein
MIFGLGGILITLLIIVLMLSVKGGPGDYTVTALQKGREAQVDARQLAGVDESGMKTKDSILMEPVSTGSRTSALLVSSIVVGGPMEVYFGLQPNDKIIEVGPQRVRDIDDPEMAKALTLEAYQRKWSLIVERSGAKFELPGNIPLDGGTPAAVASPANAPSAAPEPAAPTASPEAARTVPKQPARTSIYDQVNRIPGVQAPAQ